MVFIQLHLWSTYSTQTADSPAVYGAALVDHSFIWSTHDLPYLPHLGVDLLLLVKRVVES